MLDSRTGESRKDVGLRPGGMVIPPDGLEIGSFAGDSILYLAPVEKAVFVAPSEAAPEVDSDRDPSSADSKL